ncbi:unnamed protein product [Vitrella brassicaformis CCMP3155]|uniref:Uncharacterized protein n=1 Tax=Vitrella brassicaformis (strain CCMP3155) TaxID=1169540 RepID=A0A0G4G368_VITBC|nr:unnamed protein product [Vitrella brassicaformis CCMP3155]|mmetsp:Transcript_44520/g.125916  ORF Transcript_44520/g.125916 Transcript_44520/m.125916 type:complete len:135 (+) Transcript_44520:102-506(+)|eukprot:CEM22689.1 unnamed protein product [Vitrella brassicaformis CCMP3155]
MAHAWYHSEDLLTSGLCELVFALVVVGFILMSSGFGVRIECDWQRMHTAQLAFVIHALIQISLGYVLPAWMWYYRGTWFKIIFIILSWLTPLRHFVEALSDKMRESKVSEQFFLFAFLVHSIQYVWLLVKYLND